MSAIELNLLAMPQALQSQWFHERERRGRKAGRIPRPSAARAAQERFEDAFRHHVGGRVAEAFAGYERALALCPGHAEAHNNLATLMAAQGRIADAIAHYCEALRLRPHYAEAFSNLAVALSRAGKAAEALACHEKAVSLQPSHAGFLYNLAVALSEGGRTDDAITRYRQVLVLKPDHIGAHNNLANLLADRGSVDEAISHYRQVIALDAGNAEAHNNLGNSLRCQGKFEDALFHYDCAIALRPAFAEAHYHRADVRNFSRRDRHLAALEALAVRGDLPADKATFAHFALAKALDDIGDYARAFAEFRRANQLKRAQIDYDESAASDLFRRIATVFTKALFDRFQGEGHPSQAPVFVVGMPRSGSTLIEQILAGHPQLHAAGELMAFAETVSESGAFPELAARLNGETLRRIGGTYLSRLPAAAASAMRITDKLPRNFLYIGLIRLALPNARIIHAVRDPIDTCLSCYSKLFQAGQPFSYDLAELGRYYRMYAELMNHWRSVLPAGAMLEVAYEDVVDNIESQARRMIEFCGLAWDDSCAARCVNFHRNSRPVGTASAVQMRRPLFRSSVGRWRAYASSIGPLLAELRSSSAASV